MSEETQRWSERQLVMIAEVCSGGKARPLITGFLGKMVIISGLTGPQAQTQ